MKRLLAITMVFLAACGGPPVRWLFPTSTPTGFVAPSPTGVLGAIEYGLCVDGVTPLLEALQELNSRLSVGLTHAEYREQVGNVRVVYDQLEFEELAVECIKRVGVPLETALNQHVKALNTWSACIQDFGCSQDSINPELQEHWSTAGEKTQAADLALSLLAPE